VLLGTLAQLRRAYPDAAAAGVAAAAPPDINAFGVLPVGPRFQYLPIGAPSVAQALAAARQRGGGGAAAAPQLAAALAPGAGGLKGAPSSLAPGASGAAAAASDLAAEYSLADFGSSSTFNSRSAAAAAASPTAAAAAADGGMAGLSAGAGAALGALQARLHGGVLGSAFTGMLGDTGAAAAAQNIAQNIGDLLPGGLMSSGLMTSFTQRGAAAAKRP
jgi:hypothetical protein